VKLGLTAASLILVAGTAMGCGSDDGGDGGGSDAKTASKDDFCAVFQEFYDDLQGMTGEEEDLGKIIKDAGEEIRDVGTPKGMPDDAKDGLNLTLDAIEELPDDASAEDMAGLEDDFSEADKKKTDAFSDYLEETCPDIGA
jgi:hypothetical protein